MDKWVKNVMGLSLAAVVLSFGWSILTGSDGDISIWEGKVTVRSTLPSNSVKQDQGEDLKVPLEISPMQDQGEDLKVQLEISPMNDNSELTELVACRAESHGVEKYTNVQEWAADSGWQRGGPSRAAFCEARRSERAGEYPDRIVTLLNSTTSHKTEYTPFKHDYYRHLCTFKDEWNPVYVLKVSDSCLIN